MEKLTNKQIIVVIILLLITFVLLTNVLKSLKNKDNGINYKEINGETLVNESLEIYDRKTFLTLSEIIVKILKNYDNENYKKYYDVLTDEYKKEISNSEFNNAISKFYDKFKVYPENDDTYIDTDKVLLGVYQCMNGSDMYICKLKNNSYIGIKLNDSEKYYDIFYIE